MSPDCIDLKRPDVDRTRRVTEQDMTWVSGVEVTRRDMGYPESTFPETVGKGQGR